MHCTNYRGTLLFVIVVTLIISIIACAKQEVAANAKTLNVVMDDNYPPYVFRDDKGNLTGIIIDQWELWEKKTGTKVNISGVKWEKALELMENEQFDVIDTIFINDQRIKVYDFGNPYALIEVNIFFHHNISGINEIASLKGFKVGIKKGDNAVKVLKDQGINDLVEFDNYEDIIRAAKEQTIVVFVMDKPPALYFLYKMGIEKDFKHSSPIYSGKFHRAVAKDRSELLSQVQNGFDQITPAEYNAIDER